jgi:hypothetical protein
LEFHRARNTFFTNFVDRLFTTFIRRAFTNVRDAADGTYVIA